MTVVSYRLYCDECDAETVVRDDERERDTSWKVQTLFKNTGLCPSCNPTISLSEIDNGEEYHEEIALRSLDGIGEKAASNLERAGYDTVESITQATEDELLAVDWVGDKALHSLKERTMQLDPQERWG